MKTIVKVKQSFVEILIPSGMTFQSEEGELPAPNWRTTISIDDTQGLLRFLSPEQVEEIQKGEYNQ